MFSCDQSLPRTGMMDTEEDKTTSALPLPSSSSDTSALLTPGTASSARLTVLPQFFMLIRPCVCKV